VLRKFLFSALTHLQGGIRRSQWCRPHQVLSWPSDPVSTKSFCLWLRLCESREQCGGNWHVNNRVFQWKNLEWLTIHLGLKISLSKVCSFQVQASQFL
jgi:hypothetical protein